MVNESSCSMGIQKQEAGSAVSMILYNKYIAAPLRPLPEINFTAKFRTLSKWSSGLSLSF